MLELVWLDGREWGWVIGFSFIPAVVDELVKMIYRATGFGQRPVIARFVVTIVLGALPFQFA